MKKIGMAIALAAIFAIPAGAVASPPDQAGSGKGGPPGHAGSGGGPGDAAGNYAEENPGSERAAAARERVMIVKACKAERGSTRATLAAFRERYGTNVNGANAFGKCVSDRMSEGAPQNRAEVRELVTEIRMRRHAARSCFVDLREMGRRDFAERYGTNRNLRNAFGKCVSGKAPEEDAPEGGS